MKYVMAFFFMTTIANFPAELLNNISLLEDKLGLTQESDFVVQPNILDVIRPKVAQNAQFDKLFVEIYQNALLRKKLNSVLKRLKVGKSLYQELITLKKQFTELKTIKKIYQLYQKNCNHQFPKAIFWLLADPFLTIKIGLDNSHQSIGMSQDEKKDYVRKARAKLLDEKLEYYANHSSWKQNKGTVSLSISYYCLSGRERHKISHKYSCYCRLHHANESREIMLKARKTLIIAYFYHDEHKRYNDVAKLLLAMEKYQYARKILTYK